MTKNSNQAVADLQEPLLDMELIAENAACGVDDFRELIDMYLNQADQMLLELDGAIRAGKTADVDYLAHKLAGSSAVCGASAVTRSLRELERCGREKKLDEAQNLLAQTVNLLEQSRRLLGEYLDSQ